MAEGGLTSINDGSDAYVDIVCTPCGQGNIREEAVKYCPECQEHLCTTCTIHHGRQKATRSHKLQASSTVKKGSMVAMAEKCRHHPYRNIEMYCGAHDMVYCTTCIAKEHRTCHGVIDVDDVQPSASTKSEIQRLQTDMKDMQDRLVHIDKTTQNNIVSLEKQRSNLAEQIEEAERKLIEHIQKLKHEALNNLKKEYVEVKNELESTASEVGDRRKEIEKSSKKTESLSNMDARQHFIQIKLIQNTLHDSGKLLIDSETIKTLRFTENTGLKSSILTSTSLGRVHSNTEREQQITQKSYKVKSKQEINVKIKNDQNNCFITDICQLPDNTIILTDFCNQKIKTLDMNNTIKDHCDLDAGPTAICCTGQNEVAVKVDYNKVQFISVGSSLSKLRQISIESGRSWGMTYCAGQLWISSGSCVNIFNASGTLLKTISKDTNGQNIFKSPTQHMVGSGGTVIVSDDSNGAVCLGIDGTVRGEVRDDRLVNARGVCVASDGTVFMSAYSSNNIVMFDNTGKCLGELVDKDAGLDQPEALCYDDKRNCLTVTCYASNKILIFEMSV